MNDENVYWYNLCFISPCVNYQHKVISTDLVSTYNVLHLD